MNKMDDIQMFNILWLPVPFLTFLNRVGTVAWRPHSLNRNGSTLVACIGDVSIEVTAVAAYPPDRADTFSQVCHKLTCFLYGHERSFYIQQEATRSICRERCLFSEIPTYLFCSRTFYCSWRKLFPIERESRLQRRNRRKILEEIK